VRGMLQIMVRRGLIRVRQQQNLRLAEQLPGELQIGQREVAANEQIEVAERLCGVWGAASSRS